MMIQSPLLLLQNMLLPFLRALEWISPRAPRGGRREIARGGGHAFSHARAILCVRIPGGYKARKSLGKEVKYA